MDEAQALKQAIAALERGDCSAALAAAEASIARRPDLSVSHLVKGRVLLAAGDATAALGPLEHSLRLQPGSAEALATLGECLRSQGRVAEAVAASERALSIAPHSPSVRVRAAHALLDAGEPERACAAVEDAARADHAGAVAAMIDALEHCGALDDALGWIERHPDAVATSVAVALPAARVLRQVGRNGEGLQRLEALAESPLPPSVRASLFYGLGDARDRADQCDAAFAAWAEANRLRGHHFDAAGFAARIEAIRRDETRPALTSLPRAANAAPALFIVGVPRSGTSLVEQMLAAHPAVRACGERDDLPRLARELDRRSPVAVEKAAGAYLRALAVPAERLRAIPPGGRRPASGPLAPPGSFTDKLPHNAFHLGVASQLCPNARVIHCTRDPLDVGLSLFSRDLHAAHAWANRLDTIATFQRGYRAALAHWTEHLPLPVFELCYENLIEAPEKTLRELLAFCGLDWDARVLRFHEASRIVHTASRSQVRQPLHGASIGRWRRYATPLETLRSALT